MVDQCLHNLGSAAAHPQLRSSNEVLAMHCSCLTAPSRTCAAFQSASAPGVPPGHSWPAAGMRGGHRCTHRVVSANVTPPKFRK